jgi:hypothetical protein
VGEGHNEENPAWSNAPLDDVRGPFFFRAVFDVANYSDIVLGSVSNISSLLGGPKQQAGGRMPGRLGDWRASL